MALGAKSEEERSLRDDLAAGLKEIEEREASDTAAAPEGDDAPAPQAEAKVEPPSRRPIVATGAMRMGSSSLSRRMLRSKLRQYLQLLLLRKLSKSAPPAPSVDQADEDLPPKVGGLTRLRHGKTFPLLRRPPLYAVRRKLQGLPAQMTASACSGARSPSVPARTWRSSIHSASAADRAAGLLENDRILRSGTPEEKLAKARSSCADYGMDLSQLAQHDPRAERSRMWPLSGSSRPVEPATRDPAKSAIRPLAHVAGTGNTIGNRGVPSRSGPPSFRCSPSGDGPTARNGSGP
jgi:hypothetical protein